MAETDIGTRIQQARKMRGLSLRELGRKAELSAQAISKYERGLDVPGSKSLGRLAKALTVPVEFFLRPQRVIEIRLDHRKCTPFSKGLEESIRARVLDWLERYLEAEEIRSLEAAKFAWPASFPREVASPFEIEQAALDLREAWKLGWDPIENLTELLEDRGIRVGISDTEERFEACTLWAQINNETIPVMVSHEDQAGDRQRLSLAHELGHLMIRTPSADASEEVIHRFAGAFLVPEPAFLFELGGPRQNLDLKELNLLMKKYGLSVQGWISRARDLNLIPEGKAVELLRLLKVQGVHSAGNYPLERATRLEKLVLQSAAEDLISERRAAELLAKPLPKQDAREDGAAEEFKAAVEEFKAVALPIEVGKDDLHTRVLESVRLLSKYIRLAIEMLPPRDYVLVCSSYRLHEVGFRAPREIPMLPGSKLKGVARKAAIFRARRRFLMELEKLLEAAYRADIEDRAILEGALKITRGNEFRSTLTIGPSKT